MAKAKKEKVKKEDEFIIKANKELDHDGIGHTVRRDEEGGIHMFDSEGAFVGEFTAEITPFDLVSVSLIIGSVWEEAYNKGLRDRSVEFREYFDEMKKKYGKQFTVEHIEATLKVHEKELNYIDQEADEEEAAMEENEKRNILTHPIPDYDEREGTLDIPEKAAELVAKINESLPLPVIVTKEVADDIRQKSPELAVPNEGKIVEIHYFGDQSGIICYLDIGGKTTKMPLFVSLTDLAFSKKHPLAREIEAYQKHRLKKLKKLESR